MLKKKTVNIVTLGCSKNLVDSEFLLKQFEINGYDVYFDSNKKTSIVIVNTCAFILDAKEESIDTILQYCEQKKRGRINNLYVMGCLSERYNTSLAVELPEVDGFYGKFDYLNILNDLNLTQKSEARTQRYITTPNHYAYLKISEGCNRMCSFCAIPLMTGKHKSKSIEQLEDETNHLVKQGVRELLIIAQDLSFYGRDLYNSFALPELITRLSNIEQIEWIKLHYFYPSQFPFEIINVINERPNVCRYLDIAMQHISDHMLNLMRRNISQKQTYELIEKIKTEIPGVALRTTLLVGHPGETQKDFEELKEFVRRVRFERLGVFTYSDEEDTYASKNYTDDILPEVKEERKDEIMAIQQAISAEIQQDRVGHTMKIVIDRTEGEYYIGRTEFDSPEVDGEVLIEAKDTNLKIGNFYKAKIISADDYDLYAQVVQ